MKTVHLLSVTLLTFALSLSALVQAAQTGDSRQTRKVSEFHGITVSSGIDLYLTQKDIQEVKVEAEEEDMEYLVTEVEDGILKIYMKDRSVFNFNWSSTRKVYVSFRNLDKLEASAGSDVYSQSVLNLGKLELHASSGSDIKLELTATDVNAESSSGSDIQLKGKADYIQVSASSGSDINAADFVSKRCNANVSSGSDIRVNVTDELDANASSGGDIAYSGNPTRKNINESSGGDVHGR